MLHLYGHLLETFLMFKDLVQMVITYCIFIIFEYEIL